MPNHESSSEKFKAVSAESLSEAWDKYRRLFGEEPHGTVQQMKALMEFIHDDGVVIVPLPEAALIGKVFLPANPNKMRTAVPEVKAAAHLFKAIVQEKQNG